ALELAHLDLALRDMHRHSDRPPVVLEATLDRLTDPQGPVRRELEATTPVELLDRPNQAKHALLDKISHLEAVPLVAAGLRDDQTQVGGDHLLLGLEVAALDPLRELDLLGRG